MFEALKKLMDSNKQGDFLFPSLPKKIKGKVSKLSQDMAVIESVMNEETFEFITHPNNICVVQKKKN